MKLNRKVIMTLLILLLSSLTAGAVERVENPETGEECFCLSREELEQAVEDSEMRLYYERERIPELKRQRDEALAEAREANERASNAISTAKSATRSRNLWRALSVTGGVGIVLTALGGLLLW